MRERNFKNQFSVSRQNNEQSEKEIKKIIPFTTASERVKYLGINLTKKVKACTLKTKMLLEETKEVSGKISCVRGS